MKPRVRDDVALMPGYHSPQLDVDVRLNTNESPIAPPSEFRARVAERAAEIEWNRYPDRGAFELRARLAARYGVGVENVFVANGSNEVLQTTLLAYGGAGRTAMTSEPTYALHSHIARLTGTSVLTVERDDNFRLDVDSLRAAVHEHRPDVTFFCSPNNPTGVVDPDGTVLEASEWVSSHGGLVIVDEAYGQFASSSAVDLVADDRPIVVSRTFSKTWSMAAARLGYLVAPSWAVDELFKVVLPYHLDAFKQAAGEIALDYGEVMDERVGQIVEQRGRIEAALATLPVDAWPSGANFVLFRPLDLPGQAVWQALVDRSVLVRNCSSWDRLDGCLRVTVGTADENERFLTALTEVLT